jgi:hypothetical protein
LLKVGVAFGVLMAYLFEDQVGCPFPRILANAPTVLT